ncbi:type I restriction endonuclease subunit R [Thalassotalea sp. G20_0]|uniref:type I restriction endonuclease subunit R n=1 Tax=Thalassotalea sp. G20_0 TaxID=2821093 RepID=UPI001ADD58AB|nr:type I restriction endonuclease [Thalassotalea sp. G20_0]MBO9492526.1 type I restriction endonuclease subunit R [Thalassotalea sp. G20_0]
MDNPELEGVEKPAIAWLVKLGYTHLSGADVGRQQAHRHMAPILEDVLAEQLLRLNPWLATLQKESGNSTTATVLRELRKFWQENLLEANQNAWESVIHGSNIQLKDARGRAHSVRFMDQNTPTTNRFHVVDQYIGSNSEGDEFRPDLLLFINGLPLAMIECKASHIKLSKGINQLLAYQNSHPRHFVFNQVCAAINRNQAHYGAIYTPEAFYFRYRLDDAEEAIVRQRLGTEPSEQDRLLWALFEPTRFVELVCQFVLFEVEDGRTLKKLPRYQQWRAVRKTLARLTKADGNGVVGAAGSGGVVWHTQGSGKSLTMAYLARYLRAESVGLNNPSILVLTDRTDLDRQIFNTFTNIGLHPLKAPSVAGLQQMLGNDYGSIFTSTVQKFQERDGKPIKAARHDPEEDSADHKTRIRRVEDGGDYFICEDSNTNFAKLDDTGTPLPPLWQEISREKVDFLVLSTKPNFYVLVDEAHRSQYGFLAAFMRASLPNARFIAFTGTPIAKTDKDTLREFGAGDYIDTYRLDEAVADGATLPIKYQEGMTELTTDTGLDSAFTDTFGQEDEGRQAKLKQALLKKRRTASNRIEANTRHLIGHFLSSVKARGFKGLLVCNGREMAVRYKDTLDRIMAQRAANGEETFESRVVISLGNITDSRTGADQVQEAVGKYQLDKQLQTIEERIRAECSAGIEPVAVPSDKIPALVNTLFKKPYGDESQNDDNAPDGQGIRFCNIGLLIVSDMLLTGWDAPIVSTLYLDKPLKEHTLLQAIARVNRTRKGKNAGYIVDYYGVVEYLDEALKIYSGDVQPEQIWTDINSELPKLEAALQKVLNLLPKKHDPIHQPEPFKRDAEQYLDPDVRLDVVDDFLAAFKAFNAHLDTVLPDERGARYKPFFQVLAAIKDAVRQSLPDDAYQGPMSQLESALLQQLLDDYIAADEVRSLIGREVSILDAGDMERLRKLKAAGSQALVMKNQLRHTIAVGMRKNPGFFGKLQEALEQLLADEKANRIEQAEFLLQLELFCQQVREKAAGGEQAGFNTPAEVAVFDYLRSQLNDDSETAAVWTQALFADQEISQTIASPVWQEKSEIHKPLQTCIRKKLRTLAGWDMTVARQHATELLHILLNN